MVKKSKKKTKSVKSAATRKGMRGGSIGGTSRKCSVCVARGVKGAKAVGHNARSHEPGSRRALG